MAFKIGAFGSQLFGDVDSIYHKKRMTFCEKQSIRLNHPLEDSDT